MSGAEVGLALSVFLACAVEAVEALTIVLAVGATRSWSAAMSGAGAATLALAVIVAALGPAVTSLPIDLLRVLVGGLLLIFGLQWLRKAILRASGLKAKHDESQIYQREAAAARAAAAAKPSGFDGYAFTISFKGVLLEGLEVAFIVLTFGTNQNRVPLAAAAAGLAVLLVVLAGIAARAPLERVPENTMKFAVGVMLSSFGMFWGAEGAGASWPGGESTLPAIIPGVLIVAVAMVQIVHRTAHPAPLSSFDDACRNHRPGKGEHMTGAPAFGFAIWEFIVGDDWRTAIGVALALGVTALLATAGVLAWWIMPLAVLGLLALSIRRAGRGAP